MASRPLASMPPPSTEVGEIWIDHGFVGNIPATLKLSAGTHLVVIKSRKRPDRIRSVTVMKDSQVSLKPDLEPPS
jgi:hypothetical protein